MTIKVNKIECPECHTHEDMEISAYIHSDLTWSGTPYPVAKTQFTCPYCRKSFSEKDLEAKDAD